LRVEGLGFKFEGLGHRVQGVGVRWRGLRFRIYGFGSRGSVEEEDTVHSDRDFYFCPRLDEYFHDCSLLLCKGEMQCCLSPAFGSRLAVNVCPCLQENPQRRRVLPVDAKMLQPEMRERTSDPSFLQNPQGLLVRVHAGPHLCDPSG